MPRPITSPDVAVLLPLDLAQALQTLADERKQTIPELLDRMIRKAQKEPKERPAPAPAPAHAPADAVRTGRTQDYVRPGYNRKQRPETEAEEDIYFGRTLPLVV